MPLSLNSSVIARLAAGMYGLQLGSTTMNQAITAANFLATSDSPGSDGMNRLMQVLYERDFATSSNTVVATTLVGNMGITGALATSSITLVKDALDAVPASGRGAVIVTLVNKLAAAEADATYGAAAKAFNAQITTAIAYANAVVADVAISSLVPIFNLVAGVHAGVDSMRLTGNQDVRIDFTNSANQIKGLDLNGNGVIAVDGVENAITGRAAGFEVVDAYPRNPLNQSDTANNFLGDIDYDGTGFKGDGVATNGNIFLGGLGGDIALGGIGNDFLAGGGVALATAGRVQDRLVGGRNADFFFARLSLLDATTSDNRIVIDGGSTTDDTAVGNNSPQDADWLLLEVADDEDGVTINLSNENNQTFNTGSGALSSVNNMREIENVDASGNLYGFLDNVAVKIGENGMVVNGENVAIGASAQLFITGSVARNILIGGFDNDRIDGGDGNDLLMGGNLNYLNNPNSIGIIDNGKDELFGGAGNDDIVFESDNGIIAGDLDGNGNVSVGTDTLFLTANSLGTRTAAQVLTDGVIRIDLLGFDINQSAGYGGTDFVSGVGVNSQDRTNYLGTSRVAMTGMDSVIATGMGGVDYKAAGANSAADLTFRNQQNHRAYSGNLDLRGDNAANTLYADAGNDVIEGRAGNDRLSGGGGNDDFYFATMTSAGVNGADGVDVIHRQRDANGDNIWDVSATGANLFDRDFNIGGTSTAGASSLIVDLGTTNLASPDVAMTSFTIKIGTVTFSVADMAALSAANNAIEVAALVNTAYKAIDSKVTAAAVGNTIVVTDTGGREISDTVAKGYAVGGVVSNGAFSALATFNPAGTSTTKDRIIYKSYEDRLDNEGTDDDGVLGSTISLGVDAYAQDLVINFVDEDGDGVASTRLAEDQSYTLVFTNLTTKDRVTTDVNGVKYTLQVGVDLDGNIVANEDGITVTNQATIQSNFLARYNAFINSFMDDDTSAGAVNSAVSAGTTLTFTQRTYNGEQTVFMVRPVVTLGNLSGGEVPSVVVTNVSQHELELFNFDGRNGELNETNVLFVGETFISRSTLSTGLNAGGTQTGKEAMVIDVGANNLQDVVFGTTTAIPNNTATNSPLSTVPNGVAVHGDDFLLGGNGLDVINGGTGDDRVEGSIGGNGTTTFDLLDGGKNFYAVQVLGEPQARVYILNRWEAANPSKVAALTGLTLSSVTLIDQSQSGTGTISGVFDDTLQFSQRLFTPGVTRFTVALNDYTITAGVVELRNDGAGTVGVDVDGNGTIDNWSKFTNFENIRTVSGTGNAVAGDGQGNDTLDATLLSSTVTGAGGISYNLTNNGGAAGEVRYSTDAILTTPVLLDFPVAGDYESLVIRVDGVENVLTSDGADLLLIDETEAAKNNTFSAGLGVDRIEYQNSFGVAGGVAEPTVTIKVDNVAASLGGIDTVTMTAGRVGSTVAVDTLGGVEYIGLTNDTAQGTREDDLLDVTAMTAGAVVSYIDGTVKDLGGVTHVTVQGIDEIEIIWADGNDTIIVADANIMSGNAREDVANGTPSKDLALATFMDFDTLKNAGTDNTRKAFATQTSAEIKNAVNQNEFKWNLSKTGTGADTDTVDYSNANDNISVVVELDVTKPNQFVLVDGDGATFFGGGVNDLTQSTDRIDQLTSVERIVASLGESVLDLTSSTKGLEIKWSAFDLAAQSAALDRDVYTVRISDLTTASPLQRTFVEYRDAGLSATVTQGQATWNRIEGSDNAETVIANSAHALDADTFNLRGGVNTVKYNELTKSITLTLGVTDWNAALPLTTGRITGQVQFQDGTGAGVEGPYIAGSQIHNISSYTANNGIASGSLRVAASQDAEDTLKFAGLTDKIFLISEIGTVDNQITVRLGSGAAANSVILTGFEIVSDAASNDVYDFGSLLNAGAGLNFTDAPGNDHDTVKVGNDAIDFDGTNAIGLGAVLAGATEISLGAIRDNGTLAAAGFDFDVLDVTKVTSVTVTTVTGALPGSGLNDTNTDEVVFGAINNINSALGFEAVVFTQASVAENGTTYIMNTTANTVTAGAKVIALTNGANTISFGGTVLENSSANPRAATDLNATSGVSISTVGNEAVNFTGGNGNDTLTGSGGADVLRGGSGNDTLDGARTAAAGAVLTQTLAGVGTTSGTQGGAGEVFNLLSTVTNLLAKAVPALPFDIAENADADQIGAKWASVSLASWIAAFTGSGLTAAEAGTLSTVTYNATSNNLVFTFGASAAGSTITNAALLNASFLGNNGNAVLTGAEAATGFAAAVESADRYVFEATAALNGTDTILNYDASDTLDFRAFFGGALNNTFNGFSLAGGYNLLGQGNTVNTTFNKGTLTAADFGGTTGRNIDNNSKHIFITTGDVDNAADATNDGYKIYVVSDIDSGAGITYQVDLIGMFTPSTELTTAQILNLG